MRVGGLTGSATAVPPMPQRRQWKMCRSRCWCAGVCVAFSDGLVAACIFSFTYAGGYAFSPVYFSSPTESERVQKGPPPLFFFWGYIQGNQEITPPCRTPHLFNFGIPLVRRILNVFNTTKYFEVQVGVTAPIFVFFFFRGGGDKTSSDLNGLFEGIFCRKQVINS